LLGYLKKKVGVINYPGML